MSIFFYIRHIVRMVREVQKRDPRGFWYTLWAMTDYAYMDLP